jgi:hypothetical protein
VRTLQINAAHIILQAGSHDQWAYA